LNSTVYSDDSSEDDGSDDDGDLNQMKTVKQAFNGMKIYDHVDSSNINQYFEITINKKKKYIHKQTAAHMLAINKNHLSSDRLSGAKQMNKQC
jgi:hypothetical protein